MAAHTKDPVAVTVDNFVRAESDLYLKRVADELGGFGNVEVFTAP